MTTIKMVIAIEGTQKLVDFITWANETKQAFELMTEPAVKRKRHTHLKACKFCGKEYRGRKGVGLHQYHCSKRALAQQNGTV